MIHEFRDLLVIEDWIWKDHSLLWFCFSHFLKEKKIKFCMGLSIVSSTLAPEYLLNLLLLQQNV